MLPSTPIPLIESTAATEPDDYRLGIDPGFFSQLSASQSQSRPTATEANVAEGSSEATADPPKFEDTPDIRSISNSHGTLGFSQEVGWDSARQSIDNIDDLDGWLFNDFSESLPSGASTIPTNSIGASTVPAALSPLP